jgi:predicted O-methyltransferase YrrM
MNSLDLINYNQEFDLIWIDGAHGYPVVCIDIINSLRLINDGGIIMCDDIFINNIQSDKMYKSTAAFETLNELATEKIIDYKLIYKRLDTINNCNKLNRKFIGVFKKN